MKTSSIIWSAVLCGGMFCQAQAQEIKAASKGKPAPAQKAVIQKNTSFVGWHLRSYEKDGVYGASVEAAYEYLKDRLPKTKTIVGIVDGGVDITHEDIKDALWRNPGEVPDNGIDDDKNGYVDDIHGWNFLSMPDGKQMELGYTVADDEYMRLRDKYETADTNALSAKERKEYAYFRDICEFSPLCRAYREIAVAEAAVQYAGVFDRELKAKYPQRKSFEAREFGPLLQEGESDPVRVASHRFFMKHLQRRKNRLVWNEEFNANRGRLVEETKAEYEKMKADYFTGKQNRLELGDDPENIKDFHYGSHHLLASSAEHGQHVGGIVGATRNNGIGMDGVADADLMFLRVGPGNGDEHDKEVALCIRYAVDNGARVINMSFGKPFSPHNEWMVEAMKYAEKKGVLLVHAAGNDGSSLDVHDRFPNRYASKGKELENWIAVGSINMKGEPARSSNYGKREVDIFAPGENVYSTIYSKHFKYRAMSGTSMATPVVTGIIALIWNYFPELTAEEVKRAVLESATVRRGETVPCPGTGEKTDFGELCRTGGIVNALEAVKLAERIYMEKYNR